MMLLSLKTRIIGLVAAIVILSVSLVFWASYSQQRKLLLDQAEMNSLMLADSIVNSIFTAMQTGHSSDLSRILQRNRSNPSIRSIRVISLNGKILHSSNPLETGKITSGFEYSAISSKVSRFDTSGMMFRSVTPIVNSPQCHGCHSKSLPSIGILETELSLEALNTSIDRQRFRTLILAVVTISVIILALTLLFISYVDKPIRHIISAIKRIESGDFSPLSFSPTSQEISVLSTHFNHMNERLRELMSTTVMHERELAKAEEKLAHHHEMHQMNSKLEEHLREIENLNISLEERVDEVESANFRIADLASELEQKNTNLEHAVDRLSSIYKVGLAVNSTIDMDRLMNLIVRTTASALNASICYTIMYDSSNRTLNVTNMCEEGRLLSPRQNIPMKESGTSTWVIRNRLPLLIADINSAPQFDRMSLLGFERKTLICCPLMVRDELMGTISVVNKIDDSTFSADDLETLSTIAAQASIAIKNATLYEEQQQTYLNTIQALVSAIEASDSYTRGHSERVTRYSIEIGRRMNLTSDRMQILERAAILHDIGKIGINLTLLHKEGKLAPSEVRDLQQHPSIGMKILEPISFLKDVRTCIGQHHERYDGMGYPNRLTHAEQLLESRILAVADSLDAMTSDRPYRKALAIEAAISELTSYSGTQFDPAIVDTVLEIISEGIIFAHHSRKHLNAGRSAAA